MSNINDDISVNIIGEAYDGIAARELCRLYQPDVLLTDIRMPGLSGIELIKEVNMVSPHTKSIIISGYGEFEFAKQAISLHAFGYLLKPVDEEELHKAIIYVSKVLEDENEREKSALAQRSKLQKAAEKQVIHDIIHHRFKNQEFFYSACENTSLDFINNDLCVLITTIVDYDGAEYAEVDFDALINTLLPASFKSCTVPKDESNNEFITFVLSDKQKERNIIEYLRMYVKNLHDDYHITAVVGISGFSSTRSLLNNIDRQIDRAYLAFEGTFFQDTSISVFNESDNAAKLQLQVDESIKRSLFFAIKMSKAEDAIKIINNLFDFLEQQGKIYSPASVIDSVWMLLTYTVTALNLSYYNVNNLYAGEYNSIYSHVNRIRSLSHLRKYICSVCIDLIRINPLYSKEQREDCIAIAQEYVNEHYSSYISLDMIAKSVFLSPTYFSELFKKRTGLNYIEYVTKIRMNKACELLKNSDLKIYEISEQVGYSDTKYFAKLFKKAFNFTPKEYREMHATMRNII